MPKKNDFPDKPGVYLFKSSNGKTLYIGKAKNLKKRISSYLTRSKSSLSPKIHTFLQKYHHIEYIITKNELEALILENNLIKRHRPPYNVLLRDDKQYPYLKLTNEKWPRLIKVRKIEKDGAIYFGPYQAKMVYELIRQIKRTFPIRWCKSSPLKSRKQPCLYFSLKQCIGPCLGNVKEEEYNNLCQGVASFLKGDLKGCINNLKKEMEKASKNLNYEYAAKLRDRKKNLKRIAQGQEVVFTDQKDRDLIALIKENDVAQIVVFKVRKGKMVEKEGYSVNNVKVEEESYLFEKIIEQYYSSASYIPSEIIIDRKLKNKNLIESLLYSERVVRTKIKYRKTGLIQTVIANAHLMLERKLKETTPESLFKLFKKIELKNIPYRIEAFDVSCLFGNQIVAGMVVFKNGQPFRNDYRRFKIKSVAIPNDVAAIYEAVKRRYSGTQSEKLDPPNLILVDGGITQLNAALKAVKESSLKTDIISLAKKKEEIYSTNFKKPIRLPLTSKALQLLIRIRDEVHRFAIKYHRLRRKKEFFAKK
jgi:excinuclease ABC subunit C